MKEKLTVKTCAKCFRIHRFGEWVKLTVQEGINLYSGKWDLEIIESKCPDCEEVHGSDK